MNILTQRKYSAILFFQYTLLIFDISINSFASFARPRPVDLLVLYVIQDFCLIVALTIMLASFFSTYIFQVGLIQLLYTKFRMTLVLCVIYVILSIGLHSWHMTIHWPNPFNHYWTNGFHCLYFIQRAVAVFYYYFYKRSSLKIGDPKFYERSTWMQKQGLP
ncbi:transmembrane protein 138 [Leptopilina boulardi]|uniref:transmembrane protein 138 n=1 Tax=Leptopilina boulardi TaxID=63433 RepID=UPI0021F62497|nr:transmembrane protein 138 [Leptopilina boulardi]